MWTCCNLIKLELLDKSVLHYATNSHTVIINMAFSCLLYFVHLTAGCLPLSHTAQSSLCPCQNRNSKSRQIWPKPDLKNQIQCNPKSLSRAKQQQKQLLLIHTISACMMVRGNPSSRNPLRHSGVSRCWSISSTTSASLTSFPSSISFLMRLPSSEPDRTTARSMSPARHSDNM